MFQSIKDTIKKTGKKTDKGTEEMARQGTNNDPVRGMLANNDINNADIYDLQMTSKYQIQDVNTVVTKNNDDIKKLQETIERIESSDQIQNENVNMVVTKNNEEIKKLQETIEKIESSGQIQNVNRGVTKNNEEIIKLQEAIGRIEISLSENNRFSRQSSTIEGATIPNRVTKFHLRPADPKDIIPLLVEENKIGYGAFGDVYKVKYKGQTVALKHINKQSHQGKIIVKSFILLNQYNSMIPKIL